MSERYLASVTAQLELDLNDDQDFIARLQAELADEQWTFRTVPGLAGALHVSPAAVERVLDEHEDLVRWIPARKNGQQMFVDRRRKRTKRELLITLRAYMAKEITDYWDPQPR